MNLRFKKMIKILSAYAVGDFKTNLQISDGYDELDAIAESINMVGQELKSVTVSRNYFNNIFHSVYDMIFVLNKSGKIVDTNRRVYDLLGYPKEFLVNKRLEALLDLKNTYLTKDILGGLKKRAGKLDKDYYFKKADGTLLPIWISPSYLLGDPNYKNCILLIALDRTNQIENENRILRAIIDTQEEVQRRLAQDFHDGLVQELAGVKFSISSISGDCTNTKGKKILKQSTAALDQIICDVRDICFNLFPNELEDQGLLKAVHELCFHTKLTYQVEFEIKADASFPELPKQMSVDLYRAIQEFINNAIRHGQSSFVYIHFKSYPGQIVISLEDNGNGYATDKIRKGMGLQNIESRIKSHKGESIFDSSEGKGTRFQIKLPVTD